MATHSLVTSSREQLPSSSRYELVLRLAAGGMGTVYLARIVGASGFTRVVAIKRAHAHLVEDASFRASFVREAMLASRIRHPNVVAAHTVEELEGDLLLVMDYVEGASLAALSRGRVVPVAIAARIAVDAYRGLHAAHELRDDDGAPLGVVHRDVSPHNLLVGRDGATRVTDFGVAKASVGAVTATGQLKGKLAYMAPEYLVEQKADRRSDVFSMGVVVWECLAGRRLFAKGNEVDTLRALVTTPIPALDNAEVPALLEATVRRSLARDPNDRFATAEECALAIEASIGAAMASYADVSEWIDRIAGDELAERARLVDAYEGTVSNSAIGLRPSEAPTASIAALTATKDLRSSGPRRAAPLATAPLSPLSRPPVLRVPLPVLAPSTPSAAMITPVGRTEDLLVAREGAPSKWPRPAVIAVTVAIVLAAPGALVVGRAWHPNIVPPPSGATSSAPRRADDTEIVSAPFASRLPSASAATSPSASAAPSSATTVHPPAPKKKPIKRPARSSDAPPAP